MPAKTVMLERGAPRAFSGVKAIAFDFFGVLTEEPLLIGDVLYPIVKKFVDLDTMFARYESARYDKISESEFWKGIPEWRRRKEKFLGAVKLRNCKPVLERLSGKYSLGIISNTAFDWNSWLVERFGIGPFFKVSVLSNEVGVAKPSREMFRIFSEKSGAAPRECLFVDDQPLNLKPAAAVGMKTALFETGKWLEQENLFRADAVVKSFDELEALLNA